MFALSYLDKAKSRYHRWFLFTKADFYPLISQLTASPNIPCKQTLPSLALIYTQDDFYSCWITVESAAV